MLATARRHDAVLWTQHADFEGIEGVRYSTRRRNNGRGHFRAAFRVGEHGIGLADADGIALAAIQGVNARVSEQARELAAQREEWARLERAIRELRSATR